MRSRTKVSNWNNFTCPSSRSGDKRLKWLITIMTTVALQWILLKCYKPWLCLSICIGITFPIALFELHYIFFRFYWLLFSYSVKPTLKKVSKYENKFAKLQKKAAEFNFRNQLKVVKKKEFTLEEEDKEVNVILFIQSMDLRRWGSI